MPRPPRFIAEGVPVHVVNRGNERRAIFSDLTDYDAFLRFMSEAGDRFAVDVDGYCLMPNHIHLVLRQREAGAVSAYLHLVQTLSAMRFREGTSTAGLGHVFQRRFWSCAVPDEGAYVRLLRYVEANALRAGLVGRAEDWRWGSLWERVTGARRLLAQPMVSLPTDWCAFVNTAMPASDLETIRHPSHRGRPRSAANRISSRTPVS